MNNESPDVLAERIIERSGNWSDLAIGFFDREIMANIHDRRDAFWGARILGCRNFVVENTELEPGATVVGLGFVVIGVDSDGSTWLLNSADDCVYFSWVGRFGSGLVRSSSGEYHMANPNLITTACRGMLLRRIGDILEDNPSARELIALYCDVELSGCIPLGDFCSAFSFKKE